MSQTQTVVIVGSGISGISCLETLVCEHNEGNSFFKNLIVISEDRLIKKVINYEKTGRHLESFDVTQVEIEELDYDIPKSINFKSIVGCVSKIQPLMKSVTYRDPGSKRELSLSYDILCLCNGSKPRKLQFDTKFQTELDSRIIVIRDTSTVRDLESKLAASRRIVIVGNGGISLELVSKISNCEKIWIVREDSVGYTFFDAGAAKFLMETESDSSSHLGQRKDPVYKNHRENDGNQSNHGPSLGPHWSQEANLIGGSCDNLEVIYRDELENIEYTPDGDFKVRVITKDMKVFSCDLVALAIGVEPNVLETEGAIMEMSQKDSGILIDTQMRSSLDCIYAAGDVVSCERWPRCERWFQMRLWTQARQMGYYAGRCIAAHLSGRDPSIYFNFECFAHCTSFFGHKLVLLGKYNGQSLNGLECEGLECMVRVNPGRDYVKILIKSDGRILGAVLVGDSGLEETIENLILDQIDIRAFKDHLLDETVDIEDFFD